MNKLVMCDIAKRIEQVLEKVTVASKNRPKEWQHIQPRLVAVSKTKPKELIIAAYNCGQRHFGENYVQELIDKSNDPEILDKCKDIKWHFIGNLQRNKINKIVTVPNLFVVETVDSIKLATALNNAWKNLEPPRENKLKVMVQINTSGEESKNGINPDESRDVADFIVNRCPNLDLLGLMTIGRFNHDASTGPNPDFECMIKCRNNVSKGLFDIPEMLELSMGMSADFEHAIEMGSTSVRIGSTIFGEREYKKAA